jgi:lysophospholipase L1-like esterase
MNSRIFKSIFIFIFCVILISISFNGFAQNSKELKVLFIGNSITFYYDMPKIVEYLAHSAHAKPSLNAEMEVEGGATLEYHWERGEALQKIIKGSYDYVVLQEQSARPLREPEKMHIYARKFNSEIKKYNGKTLFFLHMAYQSHPEMINPLKEAFNTIAQELGAEVVPVGIAWDKVRTRYPDIEIYSDDIHPNAKGAYLIACVFYSFFYKKSPEGLPYRFLMQEELRKFASQKEARIFQQIAWEVIKEK